MQPFYLPNCSTIPYSILEQGDRVIFAESPSAPGIPIVYRLPEERQANPDRLNLDRSPETSPLSICHLAELDGETLYLYGPGSLDALDRNWGAQAVNSVSVISFKFIEYDAIVPHFHKIGTRFPSLV
ncbi:predicted protein, partial [Nematostella vectensis]